MKKKLSIVDIANQLNISKTTVSFILNGLAKEKRISDEVVEKVLKFVKEVEYKPNSLAKSLRTGKSNTIGLMVEDISNHFFANIARMIEDKAYENGFKLTYCSTDNKTEKTREMIAMFRDRRVDGYIIAPPEGIEEDIAQLINEGFPVVLFDRYLTNITTDYVVVDNFFSTYNATKHLINQGGFRNIGFVNFTSSQTQLQQRMQGYKMAMNEHNLKTHIKEIVYHPDLELITKPINAFLKKHPFLDAVLFGTNHLGACGLRVIKELGLTVPDDIAVVSFDDYELFQMHNPTITAIAQPIDKIADKIISIMVHRLTKASTDKPGTETVMLPTELLIRESSVKKVTVEG
ncbi:MAG: LacI family DNA-binding transcriptional regulator [Mucilaginibacter sp.]